MATKGRDRFFELADIYAHDLVALQDAKEFLQHKIYAAEYAREQVLMVLNRGVTTYDHMRDPKTGGPTGISRITEDLKELVLLRIWLDLYLFELVGVEDALYQAVNVAFNFGESPTDTHLDREIHDRVHQELQSTLNMPAPGRDDTGLQAWLQPAQYGHAWLKDLRGIRNQATHRHLVKMRERKPWEEKPVTAPLEPAKFRSEFYVDLEDGREEQLDFFVGLNVDRVKTLVNESCDRLAVILSMLIEHHGGLRRS